MAKIEKIGNAYVTTTDSGKVNYSLKLGFRGTSNGDGLVSIFDSLGEIDKSYTRNPYTLVTDWEIGTPVTDIGDFVTKFTALVAAEDRI